MKKALEVSIPISIFREDDKYIAYSPVLDLVTYADSEEQVKRRFSESTDIFFEELEAKGTLDEILTELGWKKIADQWQPPTVKTESESVKVPATV